MELSEPWYLTVVSTQGIQFLRPERSWRPIVGVTVVDHERTHETILGCDGRNPNLKAPIELHEVHRASRLEIKVWHQSHTKKSKSKRKRYLVGSVFLTLGDLVRKQDKPTSNIPLNLKCPPMRKRSPTISGGRQLNCAMVVVRLAPPSSSSSPSPSQQSTLVASSHTSDYDTRSISSEDTLGQLDEDIGGLASPTTSSVGEDTGLLEEYHKLETAENTLRRRRKRKSPKLKPYCVGTTDEETDEEDSESDCPPSTPDHDEPHHHHHHFSIVDGEEEGGSITLDEISRITFTTLCNNEEDDGWEDVCISHRSAIVPPPQHMSRAELILDTFSPYRELSHPRCDFSKLLTRLLSEWYAIGGCLLATATLNAAVFGYSSGSTTLFSLDSTALRSVTIGSIASGIGLVIDAWFLILYSSSSVDRFRRLAADVFPSSTEPEYPTYVYFSVTCRLPAVCLFVAACALMVFLLNVAWMAWPVAVLVMCFVAGVLVTLQYLVFGVRRVVGGVVWVGRRVWGGVGRKRKQKNKLRVPPFVSGSREPGLLSPGGCERSDSLPPPPYSSPQIPVQKLDDATSTSNTAEHEDDEPGIELGPSISRRPDV